MLAAQSQYDLSTYWGRIQHFARVTNPLTLLASKKELQEAEDLLKDYAAGKRPDLHEHPDKVWDAKYRKKPALKHFLLYQNPDLVVCSGTIEHAPRCARLPGGGLYSIPLF